MGSLTPEIIERVLRHLGIDIAEKHQRYFVARCKSGNHPDKNPSWYISIIGERAGQHTCRSCKWGGSLIDLVMHIRDEGFPSAKEWLGGVLGGDVGDYIPVDEIRVVVQETGMETFHLPAEVIIEPPSKWPASAKKYAELRGIKEWQLEKWRIGYAVFGRLTGRLVFVTYDAHWLPVNYTGRTFIEDPKRFLNAKSEEHPDFTVLFGEPHWSKKRRGVIVTEGAIDALAVERAYITRFEDKPDIAALNGSSVHPLHVAKLATFKNVLILTDNDTAGNKAAAELEAGLVRQTNVRRVRLPPKSDAASISSEELRQWLVRSESS